MTAELLEHLEPELESVELIPSDGGRFEVQVNGKLIFSKLDSGRYAEDGEILGLIRKMGK